MTSIRWSPRAYASARHVCRSNSLQTRDSIRRRSTSGQIHLSKVNFWSFRTFLGCVFGVGTAATIWYQAPQLGLLRTAHAEAPPAPTEVRIENTRRGKSLSKEKNRDSISSQHLQVKRSWENPGVYAWGSNVGRVVAPDSDEQFVKSPRRIPFFDGVLLRDIKLDKNFGAAISANGDLLQWGAGYAVEVKGPTVTLGGKNLKSVMLSRDRVLALANDGRVYSLPVSKAEQERGPKALESSWIPYLNFEAAVSYSTIQPPGMGWTEKVSSISSGLEHLVLLTSAGRIFTAASCSEVFPSRGQLGIPGLTWDRRPAGAFDQPHEVSTLKGFEIVSIAAGDYHSLALDKEGRLFSFGDNSSGQLGFDPSGEISFVDAPSLVNIAGLYKGSSLSPIVTAISAGGANSFFTTDATKVSPFGEKLSGNIVGHVTADTWACGQGITGTLGTGRWRHVQGTPAKIKALSGLFEFDESSNQVVPIRLRSLSVGSNHVSATMDNVTQVQAGTKASTDSANDTNWGADVLWWGGNESYQLGTGKRNNVALPAYIAPLDTAAEMARTGNRREEHRFQITPKHEVKVGGKTVKMEQRVECGRMVSAVYSGV
ncbi:MAG: hypothetical protein Q9214_001609 [Letrouitia sp. 1 TL-2023]